MDLGNAAGDALFDLRIPLQMYECMMQGGQSRWPSQCSNPEEFAPDVTLAVTQVTIEVQNGEFGEYSRCNLCDAGTIPFAPSSGPCPPTSKCTCAVGEYTCWPNGVWNAQVGKLNPAERYYLHHLQPNTGTKPDSETPSRWETNLANRTNQVDDVGTMWYSTLQDGDCDDPGTESCHWRLVETVKKVNSTCMRAHMHSTLEQTAAHCFSQCPQPRNSSSMCYIECFYEALLGPDGGRLTPAKGGLNGTEIIALWLQAFAVCPALPLATK